MTIAQAWWRTVGAIAFGALILFVPPFSLIVQAFWSLFDAVARDTLAASDAGLLEGFVISSMPYVVVGLGLLCLGYTAVIAIESRIRS